MTWGGLRGAVGLTLALQVGRGRAESEEGIPQISQDQADLVVFFVSGVCFLTTCVNAMTAPTLVTYLGITEAPAMQLRLMSKFNEQLVNLSVSSEYPPAVTKSLRQMLDRIEETFKIRGVMPKFLKEVDSAFVQAKVHRRSTIRKEPHPTNFEVVQRYQDAEEKFASFKEDERERIQRAKDCLATRTHDVQVLDFEDGTSSMLKKGRSYRSDSEAAGGAQ
jgi:hypothetical protein